MQKGMKITIKYSIQQQEKIECIERMNLIAIKPKSKKIGKKK